MGTQLKSRNAEGFFFWLRWILTTIGGFLASVLIWNWLFFRQLQADFSRPQTAIAWMAAVFGTWLVILIPLMKKKETVMGHMDKQDQSTVAWWLIWIGLAIGSFFLAVWLWTPFIAGRFGSIRNPSTAIIWIAAVFSSWLAALIPLMVLMYWKVDKAYEDARIRRELKQGQFKDPLKVKGVLVPEKERQVPKEISAFLQKLPQTVKGGHLVTATLRDGRRMDHVFIARRKELLGIYGEQELTFQGRDIVACELADLDHPPDFTEKTWLRLDGNSA